MYVNIAMDFMILDAVRRVIKATSCAFFLNFETIVVCMCPANYPLGE